MGLWFLGYCLGEMGGLGLGVGVSRMIGYQ